MYKDEFKLDYWVWTKHGETLQPKNQFGVNYVGSRSIGGLHVGNEKGNNINWEDNLNYYLGIIFDVAGQEFEMYSESSEKLPNRDD